LGQLVIVSNRVAVPEKNAKARAGGLEVAVKAALKDKTCTWFGWSGKVVAHSKVATQTVVHDKITYITLDLAKEDHQVCPNLHHVFDCVPHVILNVSGCRCGTIAIQ
jgi:trehalose 6-phosphate synthase